MSHDENTALSDAHQQFGGSGLGEHDLGDHTQSLYRTASTDQKWRPYTEGRWVYTDRGWTWVSDEKFGWATYLGHAGFWVFPGAKMR